MTIFPSSDSLVKKSWSQMVYSPTIHTRSNNFFMFIKRENVNVDAIMLMLVLWPLRPELLPWGYRSKCFLVALCCLIVRRPNLEAGTKGLLHQQVKLVALNHVVHRSLALQLFLVVWVFLRSLGVICCKIWVLSNGRKNYLKDFCLMNWQCTFLILTSFDWMKWPYYKNNI